jgi:hypothetical protein
MSIVDQGALKFNRQGRLAPGQVLYLLPMLIGGAVLFIMGASTAFFLIYAIITHAMKGSTVAGDIFGSAFALLFIWLGFMIGGKQFLDLLLGQVNEIEGVGRNDLDPRKGGAWYGVGKESFQISNPGTWNALPMGSLVRAYYTPHSKTLVNVEPLAARQNQTLYKQAEDQELNELRVLEVAERKSKKN